MKLAAGVHSPLVFRVIGKPAVKTVTTANQSEVTTSSDNK